MSVCTNTLFISSQFPLYSTINTTIVFVRVSEIQIPLYLVSRLIKVSEIQTPLFILLPARVAGNRINN